MLLVLWDVDGTLVHTAGHGGHAFADAFETVTGRSATRVPFAGRTDHQIALAMLEGEYGDGDVIEVDVPNGDLVFEKKASKRKGEPIAVG